MHKKLKFLLMVCCFCLLAGCTFTDGRDFMSRIHGKWIYSPDATLEANPSYRVALVEDTGVDSPINVLCSLNWNAIIDIDEKVLMVGLPGEDKAEDRLEPFKFVYQTSSRAVLETKEDGVKLVFTLNDKGALEVRDGTGFTLVFLNASGSGGGFGGGGAIFAPLCWLCFLNAK